MEQQNEDVFSLDELLEANVVKYDRVEAYGGVVRIGSLSSYDIIEWTEGNSDKAKQKYAGLRLLVKSLVDKDGRRIPEEQVEAAIEKFKAKDAQENGKVIKAVLQLNGMNVAAKKLEAAKKDSSEATSDASPTASPATSAA